MWSIHYYGGVFSHESCMTWHGTLPLFIPIIDIPILPIFATLSSLVPDLPVGCAKLLAISKKLLLFER
jgi:hypothetical protein